MLKTMTAKQVLDREYLEIRCKILELAASFDRLEHANRTLQGDSRLALIREALEILLSPDHDRAERVQLTFSRQYDDAWREKFGLVTGRKAK